MLPIRLLSLLVLSWLISGCQLLTPSPHKIHQQRLDNLWLNFDDPDNEVTYAQVWQSYLKSGQPSEAAQHNAEFATLANQLQNNELQCEDIDWPRITQQNFIALRPHIQAAYCYGQQGDTDKQARHQRIVTLLVNGFAASGNGEQYYSAYQSPQIDNAHEYLMHLGFDIVDTYSELRANRQGFYYVVLAKHRQTGQLRHLYLDAQAFIHHKLDIKQPFLGLEDGWLRLYLQPQAHTDTPALFSLADVAISNDDYTLAEAYLNQAVTQHSVWAKYRLAELCFAQHQDKPPTLACWQSLDQAIVAEIPDAILLKAYLIERELFSSTDPEHAQQLLALAKDLMGQGNAALDYAKLFSKGVYAEPDQEKADAYLYQARQSDNIAAILQHNIANLRRSQNSKQAASEALPVFEQLASSSHAAQAQYFTGIFYWRLFDRTSEQFQQSQAWLTLAAEQGVVDAQYRLGQANEYGYYADADNVLALRYYHKAGLKHHPQSQRKVAQYLEQGEYVEQDFASAYSWYFLCMRNGIPDCANSLGSAYEYGKGVRADFALAREFYQYAADKGLAKAQNNLGYLLFAGQGGEVDQDAARHWFTLAAEQGYARGQYNLGKLLIARDDANSRLQGLEWLHAAAKQEFVYAQFRLGHMYSTGEGVQRNVSTAEHWLRLAAEQEFAPAQQALIELCQVATCESPVANMPED